MPTDAMLIPASKTMLQKSTDQSTAKRQKQTAYESKKMTNSLIDPPKPSHLPVEQGDNLEQIKGIGTAISTLLQDAGINTYAKLAQSTPDQLVKILKPEVPIISAQRIRKSDWIGQARDLLSAKKNQAEPEPLVKPEKIDEKTASKDHRAGWDELADFFVSFGYATDIEGMKQFQTKIHHSQNDRLAKWDGIAIDPLVEWMLAQANLPLPADEEPAPELEQQPQNTASADMEPAEMDTYLQITNLQVSKVMEMVSADKSEVAPRLKTQGQWVLEGPEALDLTFEQASYSIETYLINTHNRQPELVATSHDYLHPGETVYTIEETFNIPPLGRYQLFLVARLLPPKTLITHQQGPIIRVEAE